MLTSIHIMFTHINEAVLGVKREKMQLQLTVKFQLVNVFKYQRVFTSGKFFIFIQNEIKFGFWLSNSVDLDHGQIFIFYKYSALVIFKDNFWNPDSVAHCFAQDV